MKRFILIEADTEYYALFAYEATPMPSGLYEPGNTVVSEIDRPRFFGMLSALLPSRSSLMDAPLMKLEIDHD